MNTLLWMGYYDNRVAFSRNLQDFVAAWPLQAALRPRSKGKLSFIA